MYSYNHFSYEALHTFIILGWTDVYAALPPIQQQFSPNKSMEGWLYIEDIRLFQCKIDFYFTE